MKDNILPLILVGAVLFFIFNESKPTPTIDPIAPPTINVPENITDNVCDLALQKAIITKKNLLIIFVADWCGYCKTLKKDIEFLEHNNELCILNIDDIKNKEIIKHFSIKVVPTSVLINTNTNKEIKRIEGYKKIEYKNWLGG